MSEGCRGQTEATRNCERSRFEAEFIAETIFQVSFNIFHGATPKPLLHVVLAVDKLTCSCRLQMRTTPSTTLCLCAWSRRWHAFRPLLTEKGFGNMDGKRHDVLGSNGTMFFLLCGRCHGVTPQPQLLGFWNCRMDPSRSWSSPSRRFQSFSSKSAGLCCYVELVGDMPFDFHV